MKPQILFLLFVGYLGSLGAQEPMTAYRKAGAWSYFDTQGKLLWPPYKDQASLPGGWVRGLLKANQWVPFINAKGQADLRLKPVLYNVKGQVAVDPQIPGAYRIRSGLDAAGFLECTGIEEENLILCDAQGRVVYQAPDAETRYLGEGIVAQPLGGEEFQLLRLPQKTPLAQIPGKEFYGRFYQGFLQVAQADGRIGVLSVQGTWILKPGLYNFWETERSVFGQGGLVAYTPQDRPTEWTLVNASGTVLKTGFHSLEALLPGFVGLTETPESAGPSWYAVAPDELKKLPVDQGILSGTTGDGSLVIWYETGKIHIFSPGGALKTQLTIPGYQPWVKGSYLWVPDETVQGYQVWDFQGKKGQSVPDADRIEDLKDAVMVQRAQGYALVSHRGEILRTFESDEAPQVHPNYLSTRVKTSGVQEFVFFNNQGKEVLRTSAEKDGWDWLLDQESFEDFYMIY